VTDAPAPAGASLCFRVPIPGGLTMDLWKIVVLAVIQGAAELLPVSSSAHVILAEKLMGLDPSSPEMTFLLVMLHTGTMVAVLVYYWRRWRDLLFRPVSLGAARPSLPRFVLALVLATAVTGVLGLGLKYLIEKVILERWLHEEEGRVESLFRSLPLVGAALFAAGVIILAAGFVEGRVREQSLTWPTALWVGLLQGLSLPFRGFSRSGVTISVGLFRGLPRHLSEEFSFALAVVLTPAVVAYSAYGLWKKHEWPTGDRLQELLTPGLIGMALSCLAGLAALRLLSAVLDRGRWWTFGVYCVLAAGVVYAAALAGW
jgi:undecaprenyl-diphosphatase